MRGDVVWRGLAWAVTPVHIGGGQQWTKQDYVIRDGKLCRIDPARVVIGMGEARRRLFEQAVDRGDLQAADRILKEMVREEDILERIPLGPASHAALEDAQNNPRRWGEVTPFIRTGGRPFIPGSSIKGAIRTALLSATVAERGIPDAKAVIQKAGRRAPDALQQWAFDYDPGRTEQDPFRFLEVADVPLPEDATRIDRVQNWSPRGGASSKIQIHVERLRCRADRQSMRFEILIRIRSGGHLEQCRARNGKRAPAFRLDEATLRAAINRFYWHRYLWERNHFFRDHKTFLDSLFKIRFPDGRELGPDALQKRQDILLLRLGRFNQFESKSVDGVRSGLIRLPKGGTKRAPEGSTRNVVPFPVQDKNGRLREHLIPLGWMLVWLREIRVEA